MPRPLEEGAQRYKGRKSRENRGQSSHDRIRCQMSTEHKTPFECDLSYPSSYIAECPNVKKFNKATIIPEILHVHMVLVWEAYIVHMSEVSRQSLGLLSVYLSTSNLSHSFAIIMKRDDAYLRFSAHSVSHPARDQSQPVGLVWIKLKLFISHFRKLSIKPRRQGPT